LYTTAQIRLFLAFALLIGIAPLGTILLAKPQSGQPILVILPPWLDGDALVERSGGHRIGPTLAPLALLAASRDVEFVENLRRSGAWAVRDGSVLAKLCGDI